MLILGYSLETRYVFSAYKKQSIFGKKPYFLESCFKRTLALHTKGNIIATVDNIHSD